MRSLACGLVLGFLSLAGCSPGTLGLPGTGGSGGTTGTGGSGGTSGTRGTGGGAATGGTGGGSPGTVTLQINLPPGQSFCDENQSCSSTQHLWIMDATGQALTLGSVGCTPECSSCAAIPCPELPVIACPAGNFGVAVNGYDFTWDGGYVETGSCTTSNGGLAIACAEAEYAPAGTYLAQFCATPGLLSAPDGGAQSCTTTGGKECVEVKFELPSSQPVVITLPSD